MYRLSLIHILTTSYRYDSVGNLLTQATSGASEIAFSYSYNKGNQLTAMANGKDKITYSYDKNGSMVQKAVSYTHLLPRRPARRLPIPTTRWATSPARPIRWATSQPSPIPPKACWRR